MDPYLILGIDRYASQDEIKQAYRREAMKWHPDRSGNSAEARERFHQAAAAYKTLSEKAGTKDQGTSDSNTHENYQQQGFDSDDPFADTIFWDVVLDHAIKLTQTGLSESEIAIRITKNGCPEKLAVVIAEKAYNIHAHYAANRGKARKGNADQSSFKEERLEGELYRAYIGGRNLVLSPRGTLEYYLVVFSELRQTVTLNPISWINRNKRLMRILNFTLVLFAIILLIVSVFPGPSEYKLLTDVRMLQVPFGLLILMFIWTLYRKLWLYTLLLGLAYVGTVLFYNASMPAALQRDLASVLLVAAVSFFPFIFTALFVNYFYYRKAKTMIQRADLLFDDQIDKLVWIKNRAGTSYTAALLFVLLFASGSTYVITEKGEIFDMLGFEEQLSYGAIEASQKSEKRLRDAEYYFDIGERHAAQSPPDYIKAELAYGNAADNGSLLAAYKLGYWYYTGEGIAQNDVYAFDYFLQAIEAPLAFQPHSLQLTTIFLAESYNNLGIMYQFGFGTRKNLQKAAKMYRQGVKFGSSSANEHLKTVYAINQVAVRRRIMAPDFDQ